MQTAQPGGRQLSDKGLSKSARRLGLSREEVRRARNIAAISVEAKTIAVTLKLDRKQSALLEIAKETSPAAQIDKAKEIAGRSSAALPARGPKAVVAPVRTPEPPATAPIPEAPPPSVRRSLVPLQKPPAQIQTRAIFKEAILALEKLATKPSQAFVGIIPTDSLEMVLNFLKQIAAATEKA